MSEFFLPSNHSLHQKRILAIDYGEKVMGLASYWVNVDPYPLLAGRIITQEIESIEETLDKMILDESIDVIVIGIPHLVDGKTSTMTNKVIFFINQLKNKLSIPVYEQDETLSTFEAKDRMLKSPRFNFKVDIQQIDSMSATIILEDFVRRCQGGFLL